MGDIRPRLDGAIDPGLDVEGLPACGRPAVAGQARQIGMEVRQTPAVAAFERRATV